VSAGPHGVVPAIVPALVADELDVLEALLPLEDARIVELGCGAAAIARALLGRHARASVTALEVDVRQHAKNLAAPRDRLSFVAAGAQDVPFPDASFDVALMLKSLHHVPLALMGRALAEAARVLTPGGLLYVSEPVYAGPFNDLVRLYNDEGRVRAAAQDALDAALAGGAWRPRTEVRFATESTFRDFDDWEARMMRPTFAEFDVDDALRERVRAAFEPHLRDGGARFERPLHVRVLERVACG
jgi:SAM-dependent methyltransferase